MCVDEIPRRSEESTEKAMREGSSPGEYTHWHWSFALLAYTTLVLIVFSSSLPHLTTAVLGPYKDGDSLYNVWQLWMAKGALQSWHDPAYTNLIFGLLPPVQSFSEYFFSDLLGWPLQWFLNPLATYNVLVLLSFILTGFTMYLLAGEFVRNRFACFAAGFFYAFSTYHMWRAAGHLGLLTLQWLPFCAWRVFVFFRRPTLKNAAFAGVGIALVPLSDIYYFAYFLVPFGLCVVLGKLIANRQWFATPRNLLLGGFALLVALVLAGPPLMSYVKQDPEVKASNEFFAKQSTEQLSADLVTFVIPNPANPMLGKVSEPVFKGISSPYLVEQATFLGYTTLALGFAAFLFRRNRTRVTLFWLITGASGLVLALGPRLYVAGHRLFALPTYQLVFGWSFLADFRAPNRLAVLPLMAVALLAAYAIDALFATFRTNRDATIRVGAVVVLALGLSFVENMQWAFPFPYQPVPRPVLYSEIAQNTDDGLLLDLPLLPLGSYQYYQTIHHKRLVNGYDSRITPSMSASVRNVPYLSQFDVDYSTGAAQLVGAQGRPFVSDVDFKAGLQNNHIEYVVIHRFVEPKSYDWMNQFVEQNLGAPFYSDTKMGLAAWRVPLHPLDVNIIPYRFGLGWLEGTGVRDGKPEQTMNQNGQIVIDATKKTDVTVNFLATPYFKPLTMEVRLNGALLKTVSLGQPWVTVSVQIGRVGLKQGTNVVEIHAIEGCSYPQVFDPKSPDTRCLALGVQQIDIRR